MERRNKKEQQQFGMPDIGIPAEVLFNPELSNTQKILFGFIRNLSHSPKGCWASNRYLAKCLKTEPQTITNGVTKLKDLHYIEVEYHTLPDGLQGRSIFINKHYPGIYERYLKEVYKNFTNPLLKTLYPPIKNLIDPYKKFNSKKDNKKDIYISENGLNDLSKVEQRSIEYYPLAEFLYKIIQSNKNIRYDKNHLKKWSNEIRMLSESNNIPFIRIKKALRWYKSNIGGKFIPVIESGYSLRMKFLKLEAARDREENNYQGTESETPEWSNKFGK